MVEGSVQELVKIFSATRQLRALKTVVAAKHKGSECFYRMLNCRGAKEVFNIAKS